MEGFIDLRDINGAMYTVNITSIAALVELNNNCRVILKEVFQGENIQFIANESIVTVRLLMSATKKS